MLVHSVYLVMKMVIDSSALIAVLEKETEAELFLRLMYEADTLKISAVTYTEVSLVLFSRFGNLGLTKLDELLAGLASSPDEAIAESGTVLQPYPAFRSSMQATRCFITPNQTLLDLSLILWRFCQQSFFRLHQNYHPLCQLR